MFAALKKAPNKIFRIRNPERNRSTSAVDPHHPDADPDEDPDLTYHPDADPDPNPGFQIKAQTLEKVLK
jgi:hypothetical protein